MRVVTIEDYPIAKKHPEWIDLGQGRDLSHITMDNVMAGHITMDDLKNFSIYFESSRSKLLRLGVEIKLNSTSLALQK